ncbi:MAG: di-heme oxidoredictase family protein [Pseudomonadota bacterium]
MPAKPPSRCLPAPVFYLFLSVLILLPCRSHAANPAMPGGDATWVKPAGRDAFTHPFASMSFDDRMNFKLGEALFQRFWVAAPTRTRAADGLGPLYNSRSCHGCHIRNGRGHAVDANDPAAGATSMLLRLAIPPQNDDDRAALATGQANAIADPVYGHQFQDFSLPGIPAEGRVALRYETRNVILSGGETVELRHPFYEMADLAYGPTHEDIMVSPRIAPPMIGMGLIEAIPEHVILAQTDPDDADQDGISGRANYVWDIAKNQLAMGRFGWKAGMPTLNQQNQNAFQFDIGLSTPLYPDPAGDCTTVQTLCRATPNGATPDFDNLEVNQPMTDMVLFYTRHLAPPVRRNADDPDVVAGEAVFHQAGCVACHTPNYQIPAPDSAAAPSPQTIWPYSDLLLHDMGDGLADPHPEGQATGREWRTPPLWGLGRTHEIDDRATFLHDGRARTILEAILWHGGEAETARNSVIALPPSDREHLIAFLKSL